MSQQVRPGKEELTDKLSSPQVRTRILNYMRQGKSTIQKKYAKKSTYFFIEEDPQNNNPGNQILYGLTNTFGIKLKLYGQIQSVELKKEEDSTRATIEVYNPQNKKFFETITITTQNKKLIEDLKKIYYL